MSNNKGIALLDAKLEGFHSTAELSAYSKYLQDSGLLPPSLDTVEKVALVIQTGKDLGLAPTVALNSITIISGRTTLSASLVGTLMKKHGIEWTFTKDFDKDPDDASNFITEAEFFWKSKVINEPVKTKFKVTWKQFVLAGYTTKSNWIKMPKEMMRARLMSSAGRALFPEIFGGIYTDLEMADSDERTEVTVTEEGVVTVVEEPKN